MGAGDWSLAVPEAGAVDAGECLQSVDVLSDEALVAARSRLNPAAGVMLSALWVASTGQLVLIIHHLAVDGVSWRILLEDLNIAWAQHRSGQAVAFRRRGHRLPGGRRCWPSTRTHAGVVDQADAWRTVAATPAALPAVSRRRTPSPRPGAVGVAGRRDHPACCSVRCRRRSMLGSDILLIAFALAWTEFLGDRGAPIGIDVEGHGRPRSWAADVDLSRTVGWFTTKYPVAA